MSFDIVTLHMLMLKPREWRCAVMPWRALVLVVHFQRHSRFWMKSLRSETCGLSVRSLCTFIYLCIYVYICIHVYMYITYNIHAYTSLLGFGHDGWVTPNPSFGMDIWYFQRHSAQVRCWKSRPRFTLCHYVYIYLDVYIYHIIFMHTLYSLVSVTMAELPRIPV